VAGSGTASAPCGVARVSGASRARVAVSVATVWTGPDAARAVDAAALAEVPDPSAWLAAMTLEELVDLHGRIGTQALFGEEVVVVDQRGDWSAVELPAQPAGTCPGGYPGWVRSAHLDAGVVDGPSVVVTSRLVTTRDHAGRPVVLGMGSRLELVDRSTSELLVAGPGGELLALDPAAVALPRSDGDRDGGELVLRLARRFAGTAYLWGGCSGWGVDCSGLVHLAHRACGIVVARDAHDQASAGDAVPSAAPAEGDLLFFSRPDEPPHHVALCAGPGRMLHSPRTGKQVEEIAGATEPYRSELDAFARRYWRRPSAAGRPPSH
jgi:hypothetical protein